jgi:hypothetical protein
MQSSLDQQLAELEAERVKLLAKKAEVDAAARRAAVEQVLTLIDMNGLTRAECESPTWRKRAYVKRGPRKAKKELWPMGAGVKAA